jgi:hypothetical protein
MKGIKITPISDTKNTRLDSKKCFLQSTFNSCYLDCNNVGDVYFSLDNPTKWEFKKTDIPGAYTLKNINTDLYLTSNEIGDLFATVELNNSFQKWNVFNTGDKNDKEEKYAYANLSNDLYFNISNQDEIYLNPKSENDENNQRCIFKTFQNFPKK